MQLVVTEECSNFVVKIIIMIVLCRSGNKRSLL